MIREAIPAVALVIVLATVPGFVLATPTPVWSASLVSGSVGLGTPIAIEVQGPPNGTFGFAIYVQPFNSSAPAYANTTNLPATPSLANNTAEEELKLNTSLLGVESVLVRLSNQSAGAFASFTVQITDPVSSTQIQNELQQLQYDLLVNASRVSNLLYLKGQVQGWAEFAVFFSLACFGVEVFLILATRTSTQERRIMRTARSIGHRILWQQRGQSHTGTWTIDDAVPPPDPRAIFIAKHPQCDICELPQRLDSLAAHQQQVHRIPADQIPYEYVASHEANRRVRESIQVSQEGTGVTHRGEREVARSSQSHVDLTSALGEND